MGRWSKAIEAETSALDRLYQLLHFQAATLTRAIQILENQRNIPRNEDISIRALERELRHIKDRISRLDQGRLR